MPLFSPEFCEKHCPICTRARKGHRIAKKLQEVKLAITLGGCPWGRAASDEGVPAGFRSNRSAISFRISDIFRGLAVMVRSS
jgi:hypothetical protein